MVTSDSHGRCTVPVHVAATVAWRLPGALMGVILFVVAGSMFGSPGVLLAAIWLVTGLLTGFRFGERALTRTVLRYRPAPASWLEAEVRRLLPGRQKGSVTFHNADHITVGEFRCLSRSTRPGF